VKDFLNLTAEERMESAIEQRARTALALSPEQREKLLNKLRAEWQKQLFKAEPNVVGIFLTPKLELETLTYTPTEPCDHETCECSTHVLERAPQPSWEIILFDKKHPAGKGKSPDSIVNESLAEGLDSAIAERERFYLERVGRLGLSALPSFSATSGM
jgi:hypothetical protein